MFKVTDEFRFWWPVTVYVPADDGKYTKSEIRVRYRMAGQKALEAALLGGDGDHRDLMQEVIVGWEGIGNDEGDAMPFSADTLATLLDIPPFRYAAVRAYFEAIKGTAEVRRGN